MGSIKLKIMKKKWLVIMVAMFGMMPSSLSARNLQPLIESIALLKLYLGYVRKGYDIANKGLTTIGNIKKSELSLHTDYYTSLKQVKVSVKQYSKVPAILKLEENILTCTGQGIEIAQKSKCFDPGEMSYLKMVYSKLEEASLIDIDELSMVVTDGKMGMKDAERIKRIDFIYAAVQDKYHFVARFNAQLRVLILGRRNEERDAGYLRKLYNL